MKIAKLKYIHYGFILSKLITKINNKNYLLLNFQNKETELLNELKNNSKYHSKYNIKFDWKNLNELEKEEMQKINNSLKKQLLKVKTYITKLKTEIKKLDVKIKKYTDKQNKYISKQIITDSELQHN